MLASHLASICCILTFDPAKNAIPRWCTGRKWHILTAVMRGNRVGGNWLMKWDEVKNSPWYTHRLTHRKRVTCELHDSYFRLMTIKHAISKVEWAIERALNYYITQSRQKSRQFEFQLEWRCGRESHTRPKGLTALMNWGPEKMLIRGSKESHHPAEWAPGSPVEHLENEKDTTLTAIRVAVKILQFLFGLQLPLTRKPWVTLFEPLQIKWEVHIFIKKSSCVRLFIIVSLWCCMYVDVNQHIYITYLSCFDMPVCWSVDLSELKKKTNLAIYTFG